MSVFSKLFLIWSQQYGYQTRGYLLRYFWMFKVSINISKMQKSFLMNYFLINSSWYSLFNLRLT